MNIKITDVLTLSDGNQYVVVSNADYEGKKYYYLVDINNNSNIKFCLEKDGKLSVLKNENVNQELLSLLLNKISDFINNW